MLMTEHEEEDEPQERPISERYGEKACENCGRLFPLTRPNLKYCSERCYADDNGIDYYGDSF